MDVLVPTTMKDATRRIKQPEMFQYEGVISEYKRYLTKLDVLLSVIYVNNFVIRLHLRSENVLLNKCTVNCCKRSSINFHYSDTEHDYPLNLSILISGGIKTN